MRTEINLRYRCPLSNPLKVVTDILSYLLNDGVRNLRFVRSSNYLMVAAILEDELGPSRPEFQLFDTLEVVVEDETLKVDLGFFEEEYKLGVDTKANVCLVNKGSDWDLWVDEIPRDSEDMMYEIDPPEGWTKVAWLATEVML